MLEALILAALSYFLVDFFLQNNSSLGQRCFVNVLDIIGPGESAIGAGITCRGSVTWF